MAYRQILGSASALRCAAPLAVALLLSACGQKGPAAPAAATAAVATPAIQKIYDATCRSCHAVPASGAPQTGDARAWAPRLAQGADTLLDHAINGYKGMPPMGMCPQCSEDDFTALIGYMSGSALK